MMHDLLPPSLRPLDMMSVTLPSGRGVALPRCRPTFRKGLRAVPFDYGGKPLIDHDGETVFAELAILRLLLATGWDGVWVEVYGGPNFLRQMPVAGSFGHGALNYPRTRIAYCATYARRRDHGLALMSWRGREHPLYSLRASAQGTTV
jgi:hypothetical protein